VFRVEGEHPVEGSFPCRKRLPFYPVHEIDPNLGPPNRVDQFERPQGLASAVLPAEVGQVAIVEGLHAQADAVQAEFPEGLQGGPGEVVRVGLDGHL